MAVPSYATDLNDIFLDGGPTWTLVGGGRQTNTETDDYIQGSSCWSHDPFSSGLEGGVMNSAETVATDDAVFVWIKCDVVATIDTHANGGQRILIGNSATTLDSFYVLGSDDYQYGGWKCIPVDPTMTPSTTVGGGGNGTTSWFGGQWSVPGAGASKGYPMKVDAMRHGRQIEVTAGEVANPASWDSVSAYDSATTRQWGICQPTNTGAALQGLIYWGTAGALVYSRDSNRSIVLIDTEWTVTDFTQVLFAHASNDIEWDNVGLIALGTSNRGIIDVTANGAITWTNSVFQDIDTTNLLSGCTFDGSKWIGTNAITAPGASMIACQVVASTVTANNSALVWDVATDPDGLLDEMEFTKGTADTHAIEFGTNIPSSITLRGLDFTGYSASQDVNASTFHFKDTAGTITVNLVGCTSDVALASSYRTDGATIVIVEDPVTVIAKTVQVDGTNIESANVHLEATGGYLPVDVTVTIVNSGTTATVTHTAHGLLNNDKVVIRGASLDANNGVYSITITGVNTYTYTMGSTPGASPTGTIKCTFVILYGLTNASGEISASRVFSSDQPMTGRARKSTTAPYYKNTVLTGTVSSTAGGTFVGVMIED